MFFRVDKTIWDQYPDLKIGAIVIKNLNNEKRVSDVEGLLRGISAQKKNEFKNQEIFEHKMVIPWMRAYGNFGINPKKYHPSIAGLLKRIKKGEEVTHNTLLVDIYNYFSLKYLLPIGGEDIDWLCGDLNLAFTQGGENFRALSSIEIKKAKEGEVAYMDDAGITCRYWNYKECERTKFTKKTVNALILVEDLSNMHFDEFGRILKEIQNTIIKYLGGQIEPYILTEENSVIDLGVEGRRNADDSKVPQQEKAFYEKEKIKQEIEKLNNPKKKLNNPKNEIKTEPTTKPVSEEKQEPILEKERSEQKLEIPNQKNITNNQIKLEKNNDENSEEQKASQVNPQQISLF